MTLLPNYASAVIEDSKLVSYALNPRSERGQHKARVFEHALGFNLSNWEYLKRAILDALPARPARFLSDTAFGKKYEVVVSYPWAEYAHGGRDHHLAIRPPAGWDAVC